MLTRRRFIQTSLAGGIGLVTVPLIGCGDDDGEDSTDTTPVAEGGGATGELFDWTNQASTSGPTFSRSLDFVAADVGFFELEGLEVTQEFPGAARSVQLVVSGQGESSGATPVSIMNAFNEGFDVRAVWTSGRGGFFAFAVATDSPITEWTVDTVRGTKIGISEFAGGEVPLLRGAIHRLGLTEGQDVELVPIGEGGPETVQAIQSGAVQIMGVSFPDVSALSGRGVELRLITPDYIQGFPRDSVVVKAETLTENRAELVGYLRGVSKAIIFIRENPIAAAQIMRVNHPEGSEGLTDDQISEQIDLLLTQASNVFFEEGTPFTGKLGLQDEEAWQEYNGFLVDANVDVGDGLTVKELDTSQVVTNELIDEVNDFDPEEVAQFSRDYVVE